MVNSFKGGGDYRVVFVAQERAEVFSQLATEERNIAGDKQQSIAAAGEKRGVDSRHRTAAEIYIADLTKP